MQEIKLVKLDVWEQGVECKQVFNREEEAVACRETMSPVLVVVYASPCPGLVKLQKEKEKYGICVLAELTHLQGLSEEEVAEALCHEEGISEYEHVCICAEELPQAYLRRIWCVARKQPVVIAETERLLIRESIEADGEAFWRLYGDASCRRYLEPVVHESQLNKSNNPWSCKEVGQKSESEPYEWKEYRQYISDYQKGQYAFYEYGMWTVTEKASGAVVGRMGLEQMSLEPGDFPVLSLGYALLPEYRGRGYTLEGCQAILKYCRECEYSEQVVIRVQADNETSLKIAYRLSELYTWVSVVKVP